MIWLSLLIAVVCVSCSAVVPCAEQGLEEVAKVVTRDSVVEIVHHEMGMYSLYFFLFLIFVTLVIVFSLRNAILNDKHSIPVEPAKPKAEKVDEEPKL
jgi:hypothetical protein